MADINDMFGPPTLSEANASKVGLLRTREFQACRIAGHLVGCCKNHRLKQPVPYNHPYGAAIWINPPPVVERAVLQQLGRTCGLDDDPLLNTF
jgi:hypothetical protein